MTLAKESVTFWRDSALADMEVLKATYVTHAFSRHTHDGYAIGLIVAGVEAFDYRGSTHQAPAGSLVIIHPGEVHTGHAGIQEGWQYRMIYPPTELVQRAVNDVSAAATIPFFPDPIVTDRDLVQQFHAFHRALEQGVSPLEKESRLMWLMSHLSHRHAELRSPLPEPHPNRAIAQQARDYLTAHHQESITLEDLAQAVGLPSLKLLRLYRREWGLPPHRHLIQVRVQRAKRLIAAGMSLVEVAADTGFADQSHLNRHFKRLVGVTPGQYQGGC